MPNLPDQPTADEIAEQIEADLSNVVMQPSDDPRHVTDRAAVALLCGIPDDGYYPGRVYARDEMDQYLHPVTDTDGLYIGQGVRWDRLTFDLQVGSAPLIPVISDRQRVLLRVAAALGGDARVRIGYLLSEMRPEDVTGLYVAAVQFGWAR